MNYTLLNVLFLVPVPFLSFKPQHTPIHQGGFNALARVYDAHLYVLGQTVTAFEGKYAHLYGQACEMNAIMALTKRHRVAVMEDNAYSQDDTWHGRPAGAFGDLNGTSFCTGKNLGDLGDTGAVPTDNDELAQRTRTRRKLLCGTHPAARWLAALPKRDPYRHPESLPSISTLAAGLCVRKATGGHISTGRRLGRYLPEPANVARNDRRSSSR